MPLCKSKSTCIMYTVNGLLFALGILMTILAAVIKTNRGDLVNNIPGITEEEVNSIMPASSANFALAGGVLLMAVSIVGLCGARHYTAACGKILLIVYALSLFVVMAIEIVAVAVAFSLTGALNKFDNAKADEADAKIRDFVNKTRNLCCPANAPSGCKLLSSVTTTENCKNYGTFKNALVSFLKGKIMLVGATAIVVAIIQFATLCATCCLLFRGKDKEPEA